MALHPLRLRRTITALTTLHRTVTVANPKAPTIKTAFSDSTVTQRQSFSSSFGIFQSRWFRSSGGPLLSPREYKLYKEGDEITEDTVLFEGCDYNHWLIVVDFPKDNKPPPEEMVRTYENICAQGLNVSVEEAKKRIYACSTTTYEGFQVLMSEEESEKFNNIPGVVFVLPDSYIDPVKKEYGGDKYENGVITPRPPPIQYGRNQGGRFRQGNRNPEQPRYDRPGNPMQNQPGHLGSVSADGRNFGPRQNYPPQQNYSQQQPLNNRDYAPRGSEPSYQSYNRDGGVNYGQRDLRGDQRNYAPTQGGNYGQGSSPGYGQNSGPGASPGYGQNSRPGANPGYGQNSGPGPNPSYGQNFGQGSNPGYGQNFGQGSNPDYVQNFGQGSNPGYEQNFGQGANPGYGQNFEPDANPGYGQNLRQQANPGHGQSYNQGSNPGFSHSYGAGAAGGFGQGANPGYGQTYPGQGAGQQFPQPDHRNNPGEQTGSMGQGDIQKGRY